jgi:hypothetical protein
MIRRLLVLAGATLAFATVLVTTGAASSLDPFAGVWVGHEAQPPGGDGSTDFMAITRAGADGRRTWLYYETNASGYCAAGAGGPLAAAGSGRTDGNVLTVTVAWTRCSNGAPGSIPTPFDLSMTATRDGRLDFGGMLLDRLGALGDSRTLRGMSGFAGSGRPAALHAGPRTRTS